MASASCVRFQVTIIPCSAEYFANSPGEYFAYSPLLQFFMVFSSSESITLVISSLNATMADDNSDKDNSQLGWEACLLLQSSYLYNNIIVTTSVKVDLSMTQATCSKTLMK